MWSYCDFQSHLLVGRTGSVSLPALPPPSHTLSLFAVIHFQRSFIFEYVSVLFAGAAVGRTAGLFPGGGGLVSPSSTTSSSSLMLRSIWPSPHASTSFTADFAADPAFYGHANGQKWFYQTFLVCFTMTVAVCEGSYFLLHIFNDKQVTILTTVSLISAVSKYL